MVYHFVLNPMSGKNYKKAQKSVKSITDRIRSACQKRQISYRIYYTTSAGDATEYVRSMVNSTQDRQRFICVGGDGTINEIVNSAPCMPNVEFGVIPYGSGNDFVRNFTKNDLFKDVEAQLDGDTVSLDLIKYNDAYCANMINIGFDCSVVQTLNKIKKMRFTIPGFSYASAVFVTLFKKYGTNMKLVFDDGETIDSKLLLTAIGNGKFCGGGFKAAPEALLDDGLMDVAIIKKVSRFTFLSLVSSFKKGKYIYKERAQKYVTYKRVTHFKMEFEEPIPICVDGEIKGAKNIDISVVKNGFNFVVPKGCEMKFKKTK